MTCQRPHQFDSIFPRSSQLRSHLHSDRKPLERLGFPSDRGARPDTCENSVDDLRFAERWQMAFRSFSGVQPAPDEKSSYGGPLFDKTMEFIHTCALSSER
jgi:hypothetical protein